MTTAQVDELHWQRYRSQLYQFVLKRVSNQAAAEDIVHDVLLRAYRQRHTVRDDRSFEPWLYRITRNAVIDHYRARRPEEPIPAELTAADPTGRDARRELAACVAPLIETLPGRYREAVELAELQGLTQLQTAERLGLSLSGAKSRVQRARRMLEQRILDCCRVELDSRGGIVDFHRTGGCGGAGDDSDHGGQECEPANMARPANMAQPATGATTASPVAGRGL